MRLSDLLSRSRERSPNRFAVDDVTPSTEKLPTTDLLSVVRKKLSREVLVGPLAAHRVVSVGDDSNPLVGAVHLAFSRHLPLTLSPDAIWLTIIQGFSHHVTENAEALRARLVRHQGRVELVEEIDDLTIEQVSRAVSGFSGQIREATDPVLHETLVSNFSTTTPDMRTASEVALLDTYSHYFEYTILLCVCGIPSVTLTGSVEDWRRIRERVEVLGTFGLEWWVARLRPILDEFVRAAEGRPDREFWRGIYKYRSLKGPYASDQVTGWLVDLFPYIGDSPGRKRNPVFGEHGIREVAAGAFPSGLCSVHVKLKIVDGAGQILKTEELELVAGLLGIEQRKDDLAVSPAISWCLARRAPAQARTSFSEMFGTKAQ